MILEMRSYLTSTLFLGKSEGGGVSWERWKRYELAYSMSKWRLRRGVSCWGEGDGEVGWELRREKTMRKS